MPSRLLRPRNRCGRNPKLPERVSASLVARNARLRLSIDFVDVHHLRDGALGVCPDPVEETFETPFVIGAYLCDALGALHLHE